MPLDLISAAPGTDPCTVEAKPPTGVAVAAPSSLIIPLEDDSDASRSSRRHSSGRRSILDTGSGNENGTPNSSRRHTIDAHLKNNSTSRRLGEESGHSSSSRCRLQDQSGNLSSSRRRMQDDSGNSNPSRPLGDCSGSRSRRRVTDGGGSSRRMKEVSFSNRRRTSRRPKGASACERLMSKSGSKGPIQSPATESRMDEEDLEPPAPAPSPCGVGKTSLSNCLRQSRNRSSHRSWMTHGSIFENETFSASSMPACLDTMDGLVKRSTQDTMDVERWRCQQPEQTSKICKSTTLASKLESKSLVF